MSSNNNFVIKLITKNKSKACAEVGVWNGALSFSVLEKSPLIEKYYMIDPLGEYDNNFEYSGKDLPAMMSGWPGRYVCNMGERIKKQKDLDDMYEQIIKKASADNRVEFIRKKSAEACELFEDKSLDFVFIDAIHLYENVKEDISLWFPKVKDGGILAGDDFTSHFPGVIRAVKESFPETLNDTSGVWWTQVRHK